MKTRKFVCTFGVLEINPLDTLFFLILHFIKGKKTSETKV